jgi:ribonuclease HI
MYHKVDGRNTPRACIVFKKGLDFLPLDEFCTPDLVTCSIDVNIEDVKHKLIVCSAYHAAKNDVIPEQLQGIIKRCKTENRELIYCCDANAHHTCWGDKKDDERGDVILQFLASHNLDFLNRGDEPTFSKTITTENGEPLEKPIFQETCIDLTITTPMIGEKINDWHVSNKPTLSDHRYIIFSVDNLTTKTKKFRNPRRTKWTIFNKVLAKEMEEQFIFIRNTEELNTAAEDLTSKIVKAYKIANKEITLNSNRDSKDLPQQLVGKKSKVNKYHNKLRRKRHQKEKLSNGKEKEDMENVISKLSEEHKQARADYQKALEKNRVTSWMRTVEELETVSATSRMHKLLAKGHQNQLSSIIRTIDGRHTQNELETLTELAEVHFPESQIVLNGNQNDPFIISTTESTRESENIFNIEIIEWAVNEFQPYKSAGPDEIFPALLQNGYEHIKYYLRRILVKSHVLGYIPKIWREVKVTYIPKAGKRNGNDPKSYRPISLSSFLLKIMEKVLDRHIRDTVLVNRPLHRFQFAYQAGKSTESALKTLTNHIKRAFEDKGYTLGAFLDIMGAFDNTSFTSIYDALRKRGINPTTCDWILAMLENREVTTNLGDESIRLRVTRGCPQGGVLSPLLWSLVVDDLIIELEKAGFNVQGFADDLVILIKTHSGDFRTYKGVEHFAVTARMKIALKIVERWCTQMGLFVNPSKTTLVMFTRNRDATSSFERLRLFGERLEYSDSVKYLGLTLDRKLLWNEHLDNVVKKATNSLWICRKMVGKLWGLKPKISHWIYTAMVRPIISYGAIAWWDKTNELTAKQKLDKVQRLACVTTLAAPKSAPTKALEVLLDIIPLHLHIKYEAMNANCRNRISGKPEINRLVDTRLIEVLENNQDLEFALTFTDCIDKEYNFQVPYTVNIPEREGYTYNISETNEDILNCFTDGSLNENGTGSGIYFLDEDERISVPLNTHATVFQAECYAINKCASMLTDKSVENKTINIYSDSQAALRALKNNLIMSKTVKETVGALKDLCTKNKVNLQWIPAHQGFVGNEIADECAKLAADSPTKPADLIVGVSKGNMKTILKDRFLEKAKHEWTHKPGMKHAKKFIKDYNARRSKDILNLHRNQIHLVTGMLTGHYPLRGRLHRMRLIEEDICRFCNEEEETAEHILCNCFALVRLRLKYFTKTNIGPTDHYFIRSIPIRILVKYLERLGL